MRDPREPLISEVKHMKVEMLVEKVVPEASIHKHG